MRPAASASLQPRIVIIAPGDGPAVAGGRSATVAAGAAALTSEDGVRLFGAASRAAGDRGTPRPVVGRTARTSRSSSGPAPGVEAYVEPRTTVTETTVVLVAVDGEWTRRRVAVAAGRARVGATSWASRPTTPAVVGYPQRMRDWTARRAAEQKRAAPQGGTG